MGTAVCLCLLRDVNIDLIDADMAVGQVTHDEMWCGLLDGMKASQTERLHQGKTWVMMTTEEGALVNGGKVFLKRTRGSDTQDQQQGELIEELNHAMECWYACKVFEHHRSTEVQNKVNVIAGSIGRWIREIVADVHGTYPGE